jgi:hypothetical protein
MGTPSGVSVRFKGIPTLLQRLRHVFDLTKELEKTLESEGKHVETTAKELCPVRTGQLRDSILVETDVTDESLEVSIQTDIPYAMKIEYNHTPFLRPAIDRHREAFQKLAEKSFQDGIQRIEDGDVDRQKASQKAQKTFQDLEASLKKVIDDRI